MAYFETYPILLMEGLFGKIPKSATQTILEVEHFGPKHILIKCLPILRVFSNSWPGPKNERSQMLLERPGHINISFLYLGEFHSFSQPVKTIYALKNKISGVIRKKEKL